MKRREQGQEVRTFSFSTSTHRLLLPTLALVGQLARWGPDTVLALFMPSERVVTGEHSITLVATTLILLLCWQTLFYLVLMSPHVPPHVILARAPESAHWAYARVQDDLGLMSPVLFFRGQLYGRPSSSLLYSLGDRFACGVLSLVGGRCRCIGCLMEGIALCLRLGHDFPVFHPPSRRLSLLARPFLVNLRLRLRASKKGRGQGFEFVLVVGKWQDGWHAGRQPYIVVSGGQAPSMFVGGM